MPTTSDKIKCYLRFIYLLVIDLFRIISAPIFYPIYYFFFKDKLSKNWQYIDYLINTKQLELARFRLREMFNPLERFIWLYGDKFEPRSSGGVPGWFGGSDFLSRYRWSAFRNPMFNLCHISDLYNTKKVMTAFYEFDKRDRTKKALSNGVGFQYFGSVKVWFRDESGRWYFIYESANAKRYTYIGWVGVLDRDLYKTVYGRFEYAFRSTSGIIIKAEPRVFEDIQKENLKQPINLRRYKETK